MKQEFDIQITGADRVTEILSQLPEQVAKKPVQAAFRKAVKPLVEAIKSNSPVDQGNLKKGVLIINGKGANISVGYKGKGAKYIDNYFKAYWTSYGTYSNRDSAHNFKMKRRAKTKNWKGGITGRKFIEPAWEATKDQVEANFNSEIGTQLDKFIKRRTVTA